MTSSGMRYNDTVHWFMSELTSSVVAKSGQPSDRYHLGKLIFESLKRYPDRILQIDGVTDETETNESVLHRSVQCAVAMRRLGLRQGDVIVLMAPNLLDIAIPFYSALFLGIIISAVDLNLGVNELRGSFNISRPKIVFCQPDRAPDVQVALNEIDLNAQIVTFDKGDYLCCFSEFMHRYGGAGGGGGGGGGGDANTDKFEPSDFDAEDATAFLIATSGTTGLPKAAAVTHKNFSITMPYLWARYRQFPSPIKLALIGSPLQWLTALMNFLISPVFGYTRLQVSLPLTVELCVDILQKYRPTWTVFSPPLMTSLVKQRDRYDCDLTCLDSILLAGSAVPEDLRNEIKQLCPETEVINTYGMSELAGIGFTLEDSPGTCGRPLGCWEYRIIDTDTGDDILEPHAPGELWIKGPGLFKEYYNNPEATEETFAEGRWFRTGDMFYRDENNYYFFIDRIKLLLKYKSYQISPVELENVIRTHPGVMDVAVTGIPDAECGDLPVACVVPKLGIDIDAEEIKQVIKDTLSDSKQLRGGVIFMVELPLTASAKIHRKNLKEMVMHMERL